MHAINLTRAWQLDSRTNHSVVAIRRFNSPTGLNANQQVWIDLKTRPECQCVNIELNGVPLTLNSNFRWRIHSLLQSNLLRIEIHKPDGLLQSIDPDKRVIEMSAFFQAELQIFEES